MFPRFLSGSVQHARQIGRYQPKFSVGKQQQHLIFGSRFYSSDGKTSSKLSQDTHHELQTGNDSDLSRRNFMESSAKPHSNLSLFNYLVNENKISRAVRNYDMLKKSGEWEKLSYEAYHDYILMLCKGKNVGDVELSPHKLFTLVEGTLDDIHKHPKSFHLNYRLYPVLLHFFVSAGKYQKALNIYNEMIAKNVTQTVESFVSMIICHHKLGDLDKTLEIYDQAKKQFPELAYSRFLAERTIMRVYASKGSLSQAKSTRDDLLAKCLDSTSNSSSTKSAILLSFMDACVDAENFDEFVRAIREYKAEIKGDLSIEAYNHIIIDFAKLGKFSEAVEYMDIQKSQAKMFDGKVKLDKNFMIKGFLDHAIYAKHQMLSCSTYSDVLFELSKQIERAISKNLYVEELVQLSNSVYKKYLDQIIGTFDKFNTLAEIIRDRSETELMKNPLKIERVFHIPHEKLYNILIRSNSTFVAMSLIYRLTGNQKAAAEILLSGSKYQKFTQSQVKHALGEDYEQMVKENGIEDAIESESVMKA